MLKAEAIINLSEEQQREIAPLIREAQMWNGQVVATISREHPTDVLLAVVSEGIAAEITQTLEKMRGLNSE